MTALGRCGSGLDDWWFEVGELFGGLVNVGKMFCHAGLANPVAEIQCAVLHHELVEGLPLTALISHAFAITAGADESLVVMHSAELLHQGE